MTRRPSRPTAPTRPAGHVAAAVLLALAAPPAAAAQLAEPAPPFCTADDDRVPVLVVGTYHMANPGLDRFNVEADDVLAPSRQAELERLGRALGGFRPTVVAVEALPGSGAQEAYRLYRTGSRELSANEREQIGFRVAAAAGLDRVEPVDVRMPLPDAIIAPALATDTADQARMAELQAFGEEAMATIAGWLRGGSVGATLYEMNSPAAMAWAHRPYVEFFAPMKDGDEAVGAEYVALWYRRNLAIFANLLEVVESGDDRVLVVYGQGHAPILRDLVADHPRLCVEDPLPYLDRAR